MVILFTDFGAQGPYLGQMEMVIRHVLPVEPVINLLADAPRFDVRASAYLLAALAPTIPRPAVVVAVVDPGVGGDRRAVVVEADGLLLVGPDNGLFEPIIRRSTLSRAWEITWRPQHLSSSFHGRDLFAPVAARLAAGLSPEEAGCEPIAVPRRPDWPDHLAEIIYFDHYGNAWTGLPASLMEGRDTLFAAGQSLRRANTFSEVPSGTAFWYENSSHMVEIAVNGGRAADLPGLAIGCSVTN
ncbi:MAG: SAM-dependent chlorinase/fluorinase [Magnetospirillum sp.]|nr:SAM-dependent chlorinase/fluorinase [Magnetospirillum sp.]